LGIPTNSVFRLLSEKQRRFSITRRLPASLGRWSIVLVVIAAWMAEEYAGLIGGAESHVGSMYDLPVTVLNPVIFDRGF
jgi:hypothetical protein